MTVKKQQVQTVWGDKKASFSVITQWSAKRRTHTSESVEAN